MGEFGLRGRYVVRITPEDVGERVSVRAKTGEDANGPRFTDTVGTLQSWTRGQLSILKRDGSVVLVPEVSMVAGKSLPPAPDSRQRR